MENKIKPFDIDEFSGLPNDEEKAKHLINCYWAVNTNNRAKEMLQSKIESDPCHLNGNPAYDAAIQWLRHFFFPAMLCFEPNIRKAEWTFETLNDKILPNDWKASKYDENGNFSTAFDRELSNICDQVTRKFAANERVRTNIPGLIIEINDKNIEKVVRGPVLERER